MQTQSTEAVVCLLREGSDALTTHILKTHHTQGKGDTVGVKLLTSLTKSLRLIVSLLGCDEVTFFFKNIDSHSVTVNITI